MPRGRLSAWTKIEDLEVGIPPSDAGDWTRAMSGVDRRGRKMATNDVRQLRGSLFETLATREVLRRYSPDVLLHGGIALVGASRGEVRAWERILARHRVLPPLPLVSSFLGDWLFDARHLRRGWDRDEGFPAGLCPQSHEPDPRARSHAAAPNQGDISTHGSTLVSAADKVYVVRVFPNFAAGPFRLVEFRKEWASDIGASKDRMDLERFPAPVEYAPRDGEKFLPGVYMDGRCNADLVVVHEREVDIYEFKFGDSPLQRAERQLGPYVTLPGVRTFCLTGHLDGDRVKVTFLEPTAYWPREWEEWESPEYFES